VKVLQIYKDYFPPVRGGIEGHINLLANGLKEKGVHVEVLVSNTSSRLEKEIIDGIPVTKVPQIGRYASASLNMNFSYWINKLGKQSDILHFHFPNPTAEISYLISGLNKNIIVTYHSDIIRQARLLKLYSPFLKQFLKKTDDIIITSPNYLETSPYLASFKSKCTLVPFGINLSEFNSHILNKKDVQSIRSQHGKSIILFIGRFRYYKGLHVLIESMKEIAGKLLLIGAGPLETKLKKQVDKLSLNNRISFLGELTDSEKINYLHACDVFVLPSIHRSEAFGIVQLEAMACSKPVVCTELGTGTSFVNQHKKTGLVVKPKDPASLSQAINHILNNPDVKERYGKAGYERVSHYFSQERMVNEVLSIYERNLGSPPLSLPAVAAADLDVQPRKINVLRIISRLNIGGPAIHAYLLTKNLDPDKFKTWLVTGKLSNTEGDMSFLFDSLENKPIYIDALQRELSPLKDLIAFIEILKILYKNRPDIVHTHTTKAGASTRFAVFLYGLLTQKKIKTIHTFHGHVFTGYFTRFISSIIVLIERFLMKITDVVIAISPSQYYELAHRYRIAPSHKIKTKELGFNLKQFLNCGQFRGQFRKSLGIDKDVILVGIIGRLVPIKNHKMFLRSARHFIIQNPDIKVKFVVIGDGELRTDLQEFAHKLELNEYVVFCGWIKDVSPVYSDLNILALTSMNEGTPVSVIEAMASRVPVISTEAGGVVDLVGMDDHQHRSNGFRVCERGVLCGKDDAKGFSQGIRYLLDMKPKDKDSLLDMACTFVKERYTQERLVRDIEKLYHDLMKNLINIPCAELPDSRALNIFKI
jgi:glycosyltransferase involved in cell wall biosynthesis